MRGLVAALIAGGSAELRDARRPAVAHHELSGGYLRGGMRRLPLSVSAFALGQSGVIRRCRKPSRLANAANECDWNGDPLSVL
ncbi:hypothetical protein BpHYR1_015222 [Brachionus plicatilis]|uniref:Uncharacterized protein n=1 Tax=Brachionus plicatilis TaxID=10195 RepID=A0A3M7QDR8_BRAPC|nr:hypothetical protein BpHYR1_015222 [Brachionus plicatilis]